MTHKKGLISQGAGAVNIETSDGKFVVTIGDWAVLADQRMTITGLSVGERNKQYLVDYLTAWIEGNTHGQQK